MPAPIRLMTLDPGHFHAALVQKQMTPALDPRVAVYAPLGPDLLAHLARLTAFNTRADHPTRWELDIHASDQFLERCLQERPGNTVVIAGRNRPKIQHILAAVEHGLHVLADKPWIIDPADFPTLHRVFEAADRQGVVAWDMMTERFEVTNQIQSDLIHDPDLFGTFLPGTPDEPGLTLESVHYLRKLVAGLPLVRPAWWFDPHMAGEAVADVGTHLADLALGLLVPDPAESVPRELTVLEAVTWPTPLTREQFQILTGLPDFPPELTNRSEDQFLYAGNGAVTFRLDGVHVRFTVRWGYAAPPGEGDSHDAVARGSQARVEVRHTPTAHGGRPEVFVIANEPRQHAGVVAATARWCQARQHRYPGVSLLDLGNQIQVSVPDALRVGHEAHFAAVVREFTDAVIDPTRIPASERAALLRKYEITTTAVALARPAYQR